LGSAYSEDKVFLKVWEEATVKVPHVMEKGIIGESTHVLMEYFPMI